MGDFFDSAARILATPMPRRKAFKLLGGAFAAALVGGALPASAADCRAPQFSCGNGRANSICCPPGTCCAKQGNRAACCTSGQCVCSNGTCASSSGGRCPNGCSRCGGSGGGRGGGEGSDDDDRS